MTNLLESDEDPSFAKRVHECAVRYLSTAGVAEQPFEYLYFKLLPKYQDEILDNLCDVLALEDEGMLFFYHMYLHLGSGFGYGSGPLFQCDIEKLKNACLKHPSTLPARFALMCAVYEFGDNQKKQSFSKFFLWLCDNFGDQQRMLREFSSNMGTYSWSGINGISNFIAERIPCLQPLTEHQNKTVRDWALSELEAVRKDVVREQGKEAYDRMIRV